MRFASKGTPFVVAFSVCALGLWLGCRAEDPPQRVRSPSLHANEARCLDQNPRGFDDRELPLDQRGRRTLNKMSTAEKWRVTNDLHSIANTAEFTQRVSRLEEKANAGNIDGAMLAWVECEMFCVRCHNHARAIKIAVH